MDTPQKPTWIKSYECQAEHDKTLDFTKVDTWKSFDTIDAWRHKRMYDNVLPLLNNYPQASWLTIGDGRYGTDANFLKRNNANRVLATSISDILLKESKREGFITEYKVENAENLSFEDNAFDFVFCKESYHHFPRPMIAFYEMLRVASAAVIIIEPNDVNLKQIREPQTLIKPKHKFQLLKDFIKDLFGIKRYSYNVYNPAGYEPSGNYIYTTSEREFEKASLGLNLPLIAFKGMNDYYDAGVEFEKATDQSSLFIKIKQAIAAMDADCKTTERNYNILVSIIFKVLPSNDVINALKDSEFKVLELPRNPYI